MFITAAPVGAVPKYIDPNEPKFISNLILDHLVPAAEKPQLIKALTQAGWEPAAAGGLALQAGCRETVTQQELAALGEDARAHAIGRLAEAGWVEQANEWFNPQAVDAVDKARLERDDLLSIHCEKTVRALVLLLTAQGWQATPQGDIEWPHGKLHSYLPGDMVSKIEACAPELIEKMAKNGWVRKDAGYWQAAKSRSPYLPVSPAAIVEESHRCFREGAAIVHLHTRDMADTQRLHIPGIGCGISVGAQNNHIDVDQYDAIVPAILKKDPSGIVNLSTSVRGDMTAFDSPLRRAHLKQYGARRTVPDIGSFSPGAVLFQSGGGYDNPAGFIEEQLAHFKRNRIRPEIEVFNNAILENALTDYRDKLESTGVPVMFMLVAGVDQYRKCPETGALNDDSLIPLAAREAISELLQNQDESSLQAAVRIAARYLGPIVDRIRAHYASASISMLMPGPMQMILADVAMQIGLDGVRVGLEDSLSVYDPTVPGRARKAAGSSEQVRVIRTRLETHGITIAGPEELRDMLGMERADIKSFRQASSILTPYTHDVRDVVKLPCASHVLADLAPLLDQYHKIEGTFVSELHRRTSGTPHISALSALVREVADDCGIYIRYFIEEKDRYNSPRQLAMGDIHAVQSLNFARELFTERNLPTAIFDEALRQYGATEQAGRDVCIDYLIPPEQFKSIGLRFLEFVSAIPCKYNADRTGVFNLQLRQDPAYSATMAVLFNAIKELSLELRAKSQADRKQDGLHWHVTCARTTAEDTLRPTPLTTEIRGEEIAPAIQGADWIVLPSTPTTNYPQGLKLSHGLTGAFYQFLAGLLVNPSPLTGQPSADGKQPVLLGIAHTGLQQDGETIIEASMLHNRFALNTDVSQSYASHSSRLIYERLLLPRLIENPSALAYTKLGLAVRNEAGIPLYGDRSPARRIKPEAIEQIALLKMFAHSSGITTAQQLDNLMRADMDKLGFFHDEQHAVYDKAVVVSFASASDVHLNCLGTPVIDVTAFNDIRSLAGTTTSDYLFWVFRGICG